MIDFHAAPSQVLLPMKPGLAGGSDHLAIICSPAQLVATKTWRGVQKMFACAKTLGKLVLNAGVYLVAMMSNACMLTLVCAP